MKTIPILKAKIPLKFILYITLNSIERAFASGIHDLSELVNYLNISGPATPNGEIWTTDNYQKEIARLAA